MTYKTVKNKKGKTFMDYEPGHVGDDNYVTIQSRLALCSRQGKYL